MMIVSNIKKLSRLELLYTCIANLVKLPHTNENNISAAIEHYCEPYDGNKVIYHIKSTDISEKVEKILGDASLFLHKCAGSYDKSSECQRLVRIAGKQTMDNENDTLILKNKTMKL